MNWYDNVILPKLWTEVIRRWWDVKVPNDYPTDTGVDFSLDFGDNKQAVTDMEASLKTENPVVAPFVPENTFVQEYVGVFEAEGEGGEQILLSPVKVNTDSVVALHYNANTDGWENVQNVNVVDGYVYGDLESLSPIAVFTLKNDIVLTDDAVQGFHSILCNGNAVKVYTDPEDSKVYVENTSSKTRIEVDLNVKTVILGGSADGSYVGKTSIGVDGVEAPKLYVYGGSTGSDDFTAKVGEISIYVNNSKIAAVTGSHYRVRTGKVVINAKDSEIKGYIASGQSYYTAKRKDGNDPVPTSASDFITEDVEINLDNVYTEVFYIGGNSGYSYTLNGVANVKNSRFGWLCACTSNGRIDNAKLVAENCEAEVICTTNRGKVGSVNVVLNGVTCKNVFVAGDGTDSTANGTVDEVHYDIDKNFSGTLFLGTNGGVELTDNANVKAVKYSRDADIEFGENVIDVLGEKLKRK